MTRALRLLTDKVHTTEGPRWHDGRLWFSDFTDKKIKSVSLAGDVRVELEVDDARGPSGLGWTTDGELLFVLMARRQLCRLGKDGVVSVRAELGAIATGHCNDMVVDREGRAYVGNFGFDFDAVVATGGLKQVMAERKPASLILVQPDGAVSAAAEGLDFPNGVAITADGKLLVVAETFGNKLSAFDIGAGGALSNRRQWPLGPRLPDGICLDAEGAVWVANPAGGNCVRVAPGGEILETIEGAAALACMLGGDDGRTLFMLVPPPPGETYGRILMADVDVPHAGLP